MKKKRKKATCRKKKTDGSIQKFITKDFEDEPITEDPKRTLSLRNPKSALSLRNLNRVISQRSLTRNLLLSTLRSFRGLNSFCAEETLFGFSIMVYDRVSDGDKFPFENSGLGRPRFYATVA